MHHFHRILPALCLLSSTVAFTQDFVNGDLEGVVTGTSVVPPGWQNVPFGDPVCEADGTWSATPDLTDVNGPVYPNGIMGNPYSGNTFECGLYGAGYHEGIMQSVSGFVPGNTYTIVLHQTVVKQSSTDYLDETGSWNIYLENTLVGTTDPTFSAEPPVSLNKPWDLRCVSFTATATTHLIKFLPTDDDADQNPPNGLRMGIDSIYIGNSTAILAGSFLGNDTTFCIGGSILLQTGLTSEPHLWQDGSTATSFLVTQPGDYWVEVVTGCGTIRDTVNVTSVGPTGVDLGDDVVLCEGNSLELDVTTPQANYLWQDGSTDPHYSVTTSGEYWVQLTNACGPAFDTVNVVVLDAPNVDLGPDTLACSNAAILLDATFDNATVAWQDGTTSNTYAVNDPGTYWVDVTTTCGTVSDTVVIAFADPLAVDLQGALPCDGSGLLLNATATGAAYHWQDGSIGPTFFVNAPGTYWVDLTNVCGTVSDTLVASLQDPPVVDLGPDVSLCAGESTVLDATTTGASYDWSNNSTDPTFTASTPGIYWVDVTLNSCVGSDTVEVFVDDCEIVLEIPNVFTPDGNGSNDLFTPIAIKGIATLHTTVYGRWGNAVFTSTDPLIGWNGKGENGETVPDGTYFWMIEYVGRSGEKADLTGIVTLLR